MAANGVTADGDGCPMPGKPEARAEGMRFRFRWSRAYSLTLRFGLPGNRARSSKTVAPARNTTAEPPAHAAGRTPTLMVMDARCPGSPRREPRECGSVSGGATRIPSPYGSGFPATGHDRRRPPLQSRHDHPAPGFFREREISKRSRITYQKRPDQRSANTAAATRCRSAARDTGPQCRESRLAAG